jgi:uncharacterized membrane protein YjjP (DUF1212 family)
MTGLDAPDAQAGEDLEPIELALWMGQLLMDNGAESERVEQTMRICGESLGSPFSAVHVTYEGLWITCRTPATSTVLRRARPSAVNMSLLEALSHVIHRVGEGAVGRRELGAALAQLQDAPRHYPAWLTGVAVALACAAFSRLFQGDWGAFLATFVGAGGAMALRHSVATRKPNRLIFAGGSAAAASFLVGLLQRCFELSATPGAAYVACALMVVPGVPSINAVQDLIKGHIAVGLARSAETVLLILAGALGILLGLALAWVGS